METQTEKRTKEAIVEDIKAKINDLNLIVDEASELNLKVDFKQGFPPMQNTNGAPLNAPLSANITYTTSY